MRVSGSTYGRIGVIKDGETLVGNRTKVRVVKNKVAPPFREAEFEILYGQGVNRTGELLDMSLDCGLVTRSGAWYSFGDIRLGQGRTAACGWLKNNAKAAQALQKRVLEAKVQQEPTLGADEAA